MRCSCGERGQRRGARFAIGFVCGTSVLPVLDKKARGADRISSIKRWRRRGFAFPVRVLRTTSGVAGRGRCRSRRSVASVVHRLPDPFGMVGVTPGDADRNRSRRKRRAKTPLALGFGGDGGRPGDVPVVAAVPMTLTRGSSSATRSIRGMRIYEGRRTIRLSATPAFRIVFAALSGEESSIRQHRRAGTRHRMAGRREIYLRPNPWGTGIWWTTPLLLFCSSMPAACWATGRTKSCSLRRGSFILR